MVIEVNQMNPIKGKRIIISGLVSSKINLNELLNPIRNQIILLRGLIVGEFIQRRGVSRSKKPGGSKKLHLPLHSRTYISLGKAKQLKDFTHELDSDLIFFINDLTAAQIYNLEHLVEQTILTISDLE